MSSLLGRDFDSIFDDFRQYIDLMMRSFLPIKKRMRDLDMLPVRYVRHDLIDEGDHYQIHIELPGFTKDQVDVQINQGGMSIRARKEVEKENKNQNYLHRERVYSAFERQLSFPEDVDTSKPDGKIKEGILKLKVPGKEPGPELKPRKIELK